MPRQTPAEYAREIFDTLTASGAPYAAAMREAREALADARADDDAARDLSFGRLHVFPADWCPES